MPKKLILLLIIQYSLLIVGIHPFGTSCFAQSITWQRTYSGPYNGWEYGKDVCISTNGDFYIAGYSSSEVEGVQMYVLKLNPYGDTIWTRVVGPTMVANTIVSSGDGGCVATGGDYAIKFNSNGILEWLKNYGSGGTNYDIKKNSDGGYIACGKIGFWNGYAIKIDSLGNVIWQKTYPSSFLKIYNAVVEAYDGGYIMVGVNADFESDTARAIVTKIDTSGNIVWERKYKIRNIGASASTIAKVNGSYLVGAGVNSFFKISLTGDTLYTILNIPYEPEYFYDLEVINNNRFIYGFGKDTIYPPYRNFNMLITDSLGNIVYNRTLPGIDYIQNISILPMQNCDLVFGGTIQYEYTGDRDVFAMRTDSMLYAPPILIYPIKHQVPDGFRLYQNYPNPFNSSTCIRFCLPVKCRVRVDVFDVRGSKIKSLINEELIAGVHNIGFDGLNLSSGIYFYVLTTERTKLTKKMILLK